MDVGEDARCGIDFVEAPPPGVEPVLEGIELDAVVGEVDLVVAHAHAVVLDVHGRGRLEGTAGVPEGADEASLARGLAGAERRKPALGAGEARHRVPVEAVFDGAREGKAFRFRPFEEGRADEVGVVDEVVAEADFRIVSGVGSPDAEAVRRFQDAAPVEPAPVVEGRQRQAIPGCAVAREPLVALAAPEGEEHALRLEGPGRPVVEVLVHGRALEAHDLLRAGKVSGEEGPVPGKEDIAFRHAEQI